MTTWKSNCCHSSIAGGWPESDICADCGEHCDAYDEESVAEEADRLMNPELYCQDCEWWQDDFDEFANYQGE